MFVSPQAGVKIWITGCLSGTIGNKTDPPPGTSNNMLWYQTTYLSQYLIWTTLWKSDSIRPVFVFLFMESKALWSLRVEKWISNVLWRLTVHHRLQKLNFQVLCQFCSCFQNDFVKTLKLPKHHTDEELNQHFFHFCYWSFFVYASTQADSMGMNDNRLIKIHFMSTYHASE